MIQASKRLGLLILQLTTLFLLVAGFGLWRIYQTTLENKKIDLAAIASRNSSLINALEKNHPPQEILGILQTTYHQAKITNVGEELWIAENRNGQLICLAIYSWQDSHCFPPLGVPADWAKPMKLALAGESGTIIAPDYRGKQVIAAFQTIPELPWGMVVKVDLARVQEPFLRTGLIILGLTVVTACLGGILFFQVNSPVMDSWNYVVEKHKFLQELQQERNFIINILEHTDNLIIVLDTNFNIVLFNKTCEVITHYHSREIIGQNFINLFIVPEEKEEIIRILKELNKNKNSIDHVNYWLTKEGDKRLISWKNTPILDAKGQVSYFIKNGIDITEKVFVEKALLESQSQFQTMFEKANVGMALLDLDGKVISSNKALQYLIFYSEFNLEEKSFSELIYPPENENFQHFYQEFINGDRDYFQMEASCLTQEQQIIWVQLVVSAIRTDDNLFKFAVAMIEDISRRKEAEQAKAELTERNQSLVIALGEIVYREDLISNFITWDGRYSDILGYSAKQISHYGRHWLDLIHPDDRSQFLEERNRAIADNHFLDIEYRVQHQDGSYRWIQDRGVIHEENEQPQNIVGIMLDITERKVIELALQTSNQKLNETIEQLEKYNQDILLMNELTDYVQTCKNVQEAYQIFPPLLQSLFPNCGGNLFWINSKNVSPDSQIEMVAAWGNTYSKPEFSLNECWALKRSHSHYFGEDYPQVFCEHILSNSDLKESLCLPLINEGKQKGLLFIASSLPSILTTAKQQIARTLAENISLVLGNLELREILEFQSIHDPLTGLYNRHYWESALERQIKLAERRGSFLSVIMLDVDHFKHFNDTFGHQTGDYVLKEISQVLAEHCRSTDIVCRYGGEEFLLILLDSTLENAFKRAEDLRLAIKQLELYSGDQYLGKLTASFGVAAYPQSVQHGAELILVADQALLQAKQEGRDRVISYQVSEH